MDLNEEYPPSEPCSCEICVSYCARPGWWTVAEAEKAMAAGYALRMMLEISPEKSFGVLSPAFKGNEVNYAMQLYSDEGCTFLADGLCELFGTGLQPLECRFCHHDRIGLGEKCHGDIELEWNTEQAKRLIVRWGNISSFWLKQGLEVHEKTFGKRPSDTGNV
jgi:hypothetical protein